MADIHPTYSGDANPIGETGAVRTFLGAMLQHSSSAIYKGRYEGAYCFEDQIDIGDSPDSGRCPHCGQIGKNIAEERYFFRLSAFQGKVRALYRYRPQLLQPGTQRQEIEEFIERGMPDIPISCRSTDGGIAWTDDAGQDISETLTSLVHYLSALGFGSEGHGSDDFRKYWPPDLQITDKAGLLHHAVYWPAFLIAAELRVPRHIFAYSAVSFESDATDVAPLEQFSDEFGSDALRYSLLREVPYDVDKTLTLEEIGDRYDADLVNGYGNLARRILMLVARHCDGKIPVPRLRGDFAATIEIAAAHARAEVRFLFDHNDFSEGLRIIQRLITLIDKTLTGVDPGDRTIEADKQERLQALIHDACQGLAIISLMLHPAVPRATDAVWKSLGQTTRLEDQLVDETPFASLIPGTPLGRGEDVFSRAIKTKSHIAPTRS